MTEPLTKPCCRDDCDQLVVQREGEPRKSWRRRAHCGTLCARRTYADKRRAGTAAALEPRHCIGCGVLLVREYAESASNFAKRKSCCLPRCKAAAHEAGMAKVRQANATTRKPCDACGRPTAGRAICHSCAARKVKPPKAAQPAPAIQLASTWQVYHTGVALPEYDPVAAEIRRLVQAGVAVTTIRRGQGGQLEYLCKARAG